MTSGAKAAACGRLASLSAISAKGNSLLSFLSYMKILYFDKIFFWRARTSHSQNWTFELLTIICTTVHTHEDILLYIDILDV